MEFVIDKKIQDRIKKILQRISMPHINAKNAKRIVCFRSYGSTSRARARIWSLPQIWQKALKVKPHYCIEVLSEKFDKMSKDNQTRVLIHELLHIPKTFSGALRPHRGRGNWRIDGRSVNKLFKQYQKNTN